MSKKTLLLVRISAYYVITISLLLLIISMKPQWVNYLPVGGLNHLAQLSQGDMSDMVQEVVESRINPFDVLDHAIRLFIAMIGATLLMLPIRWVYMSIGLTQNYNHAVAASLIILPLIVTGIVVIVQFSLALAFSLAGIVAGVRYRTTLKNTSDALFVFVAIGIGLSAGTSALGIGLVMSMFFCLAVISLPPITPRASDSPKSPWKVDKSSGKSKDSESDD
jgi:hypothetical protein